ncbi:Sina domain containing protein, partial [Asbolus verrucosus]
NLLSVFPIYITADSRNICGRCAAAPNNCIRNRPYEAVSQFLKFPCRYKSDGCHEEMLPKDLPPHEELCSFRAVKCPLTARCGWEASRPHLLQHIHDEHSNVILKNGEFELNLTDSSECTSLLVHNNALLVVERKFDATDEVLRCAVHHPEPDSAKRSCRLSVRNNNRKASVQFQTTSSEDVTFTDLYLGRMARSTVAFGRLSLEKASKREGDVISVLKSCLKCSRCSQLLMPPIYQRFREQATLCSRCEHEHVTSCGVCGRCTYMPEIDLRNVLLEKIADLLVYQCENERNGCTFSARPDQMRLHQELCLYGDLECLVGEFEECGWRGIGHGLMEHVLGQHRQLMAGSEISVDFRPHCRHCALLKFADRLFRVVFVRDREEEKERCCWTVQTVGHSEDDFRYEIELIDEESGRGMVVRRACVPLLSVGELLENDNYYCYFYDD